MPPVKSHIVDLEVSSLELDPRSAAPLDIPTYLSSLSLEQRQALTQSDDFLRTYGKRSDASSTHDNLVTRILTARDNAATTSHIDPSSGGVDPNAIDMKAVQAVFALIGAAFVVLAIWFFFWAKNGGFKWQKNDWEEYKSTVLRRKGPNGTTLSNATKSTKLGGGSVVGQGYSDDGSSWTGTEDMTEMTSEAPVVKEKKTKSKKNTAKDAKIRQVQQENWEGGHDNDVRAYRHEKVARVGGLNRDSEAQFYGTDYTASETRSNARRDFSYGQDTNFSAAQDQPPRPPRHASPSKASASRQSVPGGFNEPLDFSDTQSTNTKSYHHPIPGLGRNAHGGFRRNREDPLAD